MAERFGEESMKCGPVSEPDLNLYTILLIVYLFVQSEILIRRNNTFLISKRQDEGLGRRIILSMRNGFI